MKKGFTLAEVLITLGVIGIVAALTLPSVIANHREKVTVTQLQQTYNLIQQATQHMIQDEGVTIDDFGTNAEERINKYVELLPKYLKVIKTCPIGDRECVPFTYLGFGYPWVYPNMYLNSGTLLVIKSEGDCWQDTTLEKCDPVYHKECHGTYIARCGTIWVDINGKKDPNTSGKDVFEFAIVQNGIVPAGLPRETIFSLEKSCLNDDVPYKGRCTAWAIHKKNMDFLHCPEKLGWNKASSCKE